MEVFSDIGLGPIRADGGVTHRNQGSKKQNSKPNTNTQIQLHKKNKYNYKKRKYKRGDTPQPGDNRQKCQDRFFCCNDLIGIDISQTLPMAMCRNNVIPNINIVLQISQMDGWMALTLSSAISADPDEQISWFSPRWCRPQTLK